MPNTTVRRKHARVLGVARLDAHEAIRLMKGNGRSRIVLTSVNTVLVLVALVACLVPARRASRIDPLIALRQE